MQAASACVAWEGSASRLNRDENSHGQPNQKYALTAARILVHYMINGGFLGAGGAANRDNNYILDHIARLRGIPVHVVHGRYDRVCPPHSPPGSGDVTPRSRCQRCERIADAKVRIRPRPAASQLFGCGSGGTSRIYSGSITEASEPYSSQ